MIENHDAVDNQHRSPMEMEWLLEKYLNFLITLAGLDFSAKLEVGTKADVFDALAAGLNMLSEELHHSTVTKEFMETVLRAMTDMVIVLNLDGSIKEVNARACELLGYSQKEFEGRLFEELIIKNNNERATLNISSLRGKVEKESLLELRAQYQSKASVDIPVILSVSSIKNREGNLTGILLVAKDARESELIKSLKETQNQLIQSQKLESIGRLAGGIAHDFNNLLGGILSYVSLIKKRFSHDETTMRQLSIIESSAERGALLTKNLLGFARKGQYEKVKFSLNDTILEAQNLLYWTIDKTINTRTDLAQDLWLTEGDSTQILQILLNLSVNSKDAMPEGGELLFESRNFIIDPHFSKMHGDILPGRYVQLSVSDTGIGIPKEIQGKVFDPFFTTKEPGKGTGLGLSMVYGIMQNHKGLVTLFSEIERGTRIDLYFPALDSHEAVDVVKAEKSKVSPSLERRMMTGWVVLVVDDEETMRNAVKDILEEEGATLLFAYNGEEAVELVSKNGSIIRMVLLDLIMPKMDGIKAFHAIRAAAPEVEIIFCSGYAESTQITMLRQTGKVDFIQKPFKADELVNLMLKNQTN